MKKKFFTSDEEAQIVRAIQEAEGKTSGEIRVHVQHRAQKDSYQHATHIFKKLGMTKTQEKNGVLIYLAPQSRQFVVLGDLGIHEKVAPDFWDKIRDAMQEDFKRGDFVKGLVDGVTACGRELGRYFPRKSDDKNELSDQISTDG